MPLVAKLVILMLAKLAPVSTSLSLIAPTPSASNKSAAVITRAVSSVAVKVSLTATGASLVPPMVIVNVVVLISPSLSVI